MERSGSPGRVSMSLSWVLLELSPVVTPEATTRSREMETVLARSMSVAVRLPEAVRAASVSVRVLESEFWSELTERTGSSLAPLMVMTTSCVAVLGSSPVVTPESSVMVMV